MTRRDVPAGTSWNAGPVQGQPGQVRRLDRAPEPMAFIRGFHSMMDHHKDREDDQPGGENCQGGRTGKEEACDNGAHESAYEDPQPVPGNSGVCALEANESRVDSPDESFKGPLPHLLRVFHARKLEERPGAEKPCSRLAALYDHVAGLTLTVYEHNEGLIPG